MAFSDRGSLLLSLFFLLLLFLSSLAYISWRDIGVKLNYSLSCTECRLSFRLKDPSACYKTVLGV